MLKPDPELIRVSLGGTDSARFVLTSGGIPIAGESVTFTIVDAPGTPEPETHGAMLLNESAVTDTLGVASVEVRVDRSPVFQVHAAAGNAEADVAVIVADAVGNVVVVPFLAPTSNAYTRTSRIEVLLLDGKRCADIDLADPPRPSRGVSGLEQLPPSGGMAHFEIVNTAESSAIVGSAHDAHGVRIALGCVDLMGSSLVEGGSVEVSLPLLDAIPNPVGRFTVASPVAFVPPLAAAALIAGPWRDLGDCPLDPAQLLLDCTIDALSPETAGDPLDCKPSAVAGGEGALGDALAARRGLPITTACRGAFDSAMAPSLDAIAMGLFGSPTPALLIALPAIGDDAAHVLDTVRLSSTLEVQTAGRPDEYVVTHTLAGARFMSFATRETAEVALTPLALPALTAYTTAITRDGLLVIDNHGFSLRLGRVARAGFGAVALAPRGVAPDAGGLIAAIAALARSPDGAVSGCAAFDRALCAAVGSAAGCLATACPAGLGALAARLDRRLRRRRRDRAGPLPRRRGAAGQHARRPARHGPGGSRRDRDRDLVGRSAHRLWPRAADDEVRGRQAVAVHRINPSAPSVIRPREIRILASWRPGVFSSPAARAATARANGRGGRGRVPRAATSPARAITASHAATASSRAAEPLERHGAVGERRELAVAAGERAIEQRQRIGRSPGAERDRAEPGGEPRLVGRQQAAGGRRQRAVVRRQRARRRRPSSSKVRSPSRRCHSQSGTGDEAGRAASGTVAFPSCGEKANVAGISRLAISGANRGRRRTNTRASASRNTSAQRSGSHQATRRLTPAYDKQGGLHAVAVHRRVPLGAGQVAAAEQAVELGRISGQPRIDEHAVAGVAAGGIEQQVRADLEVVVHAIAQAVRVDERDRGERQLARVEIDPAAARPATRGPTASPASSAATPTDGIGSGSSRGQRARSRSAVSREADREQRRRDQRDVGGEAHRAHGERRERPAREAASSRPGRRAPGDGHATPPAAARIDEQRRIGQPARRAELVDRVERGQRQMQAQVARADADADRRGEHGGRRAQRRQRRAAAPRRRDSIEPRAGGRERQQQRRHERPRVQVGPQARRPRTRDRDAHGAPARASAAASASIATSSADRAEQREEVRALDEPLPTDVGRRRQRQRAGAPVPRRGAGTARTPPRTPPAARRSWRSTIAGKPPRA